MGIPRRKIYRMPWTKHDNPGGWVEVTDECNLFCPGCYRHRLEGHRKLEDVKKDILLCQQLTNCDRMAVAGGEPLLYPQIVEVIDFIRSHKMKPVLLTNGENLDWNFAVELKKAGLAKYHFHIDSGQKRPGWMNKNEGEMNELRQKYADLCWELGGVLCGYNVTVTRKSLPYLPKVVEWCWKNIHKVQHMSLVAIRAIPITESLEYRTNDQVIDASKFQHSSAKLDDINITTDEMFLLLENYFGKYQTSAYLSGTADPETYKFLIAINIGTKNYFYGIMGGKGVKFIQNSYHFFKKRYCAFMENPKSGKKIFLLSFLDKGVRQSFYQLMKTSFKNPKHFFNSTYIQSVSLQQPNEYLGGKANLCDGCMNMMIHDSELINSCRLDEYRMFGGKINPVIKITDETTDKSSTL